MERHGFRTLAPATRPRPSLPEPDSFAKRKRTSVACDACRNKRTGCDGARPACTACRRRDSECTYMNQADQEMRPTVLKRENAVLRERVLAFQDLVNRLDSMPQHAARHVLQRLKTGMDPIVVLKSVQGAPPDVLPSDHELARAMLPPIQSNAEFELLLHHPNAFPLLDLSTRAQTMGNTLPRTPTSSTHDCDPAASFSTASMLFTDDQAHNRPAETSFVHQSHESQVSMSTAPDYWDPRLAHLSIEFWTSVPISNAQAASAISLYLEVQHPCYAVFDAGLFVRDLVELRFDFCSPFLVSSLLALACLFNSRQDAEASVKSFVFEEEAEKLLKSETGIGSLSTVAGMALLYMSLSIHGEKLRATRYIARSIAMAERLKLFGVPEVLEDLGNPSWDTRVALSAAAWGLFNYAIHQSRFYLVPSVPYPPKLPFPGELTTPPPSQHGASSQFKVPVEKLTQLDHVIAMFSKCWIIVNEVLLIYRDKGGNVGTVAFALSKYTKLLRLCDELPDMLIRKDRSENYALIFHQMVHLTILDIFRPFVKPEDQFGSRSYLPQGASPRTIYAASVKQLKGLVFEYTFQYPPAHYNLYFLAALMYVAYAVANEAVGHEQYAYFSYFLLVTLRCNWAPEARSIHGIVQALLAIAYDKSVITRAGMANLTEQFSGEGLAAKANLDLVAFVVDFDRAIGDAKGATVNNLTSRFEEITVFDEFTTDVL